MIKTPRIIELPSESIGELTPDLVPALSRPLDKASIDARMHDYLAWEAGARVAPRTSADGKFALLEDSRQPELKRKVSLRRIFALGAIVIGGAAVGVGLIERAHNQQQTFYEPATPELAQK